MKNVHGFEQYISSLLKLWNVVRYVSATFLLGFAVWLLIFPELLGQATKVIGFNHVYVLIFFIIIFEKWAGILFLCFESVLRG